jgi:hypothetical protein
MSESLKNTIRSFTDDPHTLKQVGEIATCSLGEILELCGGKPGKRKAGPYATFIGECMKNKPIKGKPFGAAAQYMKECSLEWKQKKGG